MSGFKTKILQHESEKVTVSVGDQFAWREAQQWEVLAFSEDGVFCKLLTGTPGSEWRYCIELDGTAEWTETAVAKAMIDR